jgi:hypothetical protein
VIHPIVLGGLDLRGPLGPSDVDPDDIRDAACDATATSQLCNPPVRDPDTPEPPDLSDVGDPTGGLGFLGQLLVVVLVAALVLAIVWLVMRWRDGKQAGDDGDDIDDGDRDEEVDEEIGARVIDVQTPPDRWRHLASEHRDAGRYRDSIRCEYRALVGDLARAGYVDEIPGRTSGEERTQVAEIAPRLGEVGRIVSSEFDVAAGTFDVAWFDDCVVTRADDERFLSAQATVLEAAVSENRARGRR